jgi:hypothetical protein
MIVYSAIFGGKDSIKNNQYQSDALEYHMFTDKKVSSNLWNIRHRTPSAQDPCRAAKIYKIHPCDYFPNHHFSMWIDGHIAVKKNPHELIDYLNNADIAVFQPPAWKRNAKKYKEDLYYEAQLCKGWTKDDINTIDKQIEKYRAEGIKENSGLYRCTVILRRHSKAVRKFSSLWWHEIKNGSRRDQISFPYVVQTLNTKIAIIPHEKFNAYFNKSSHLFD